MRFRISQKVYLEPKWLRYLGSVTDLVNPVSCTNTRTSPGPQRTSTALVERTNYARQSSESKTFRHWDSNPGLLGESQVS